uniref:Endonuclease/exonuclease/phosphatase domain-containing protein n=1 Tax=Nelumbo nucifera TaxID=4432 RepID=A0A822YG75_NELNU|nr:TPA_asm: hypothetical protein HUJ06_012035 [Nelumbo nucifera]
MLRHLVHTNLPEVVFLSETKLSVEEIKRKLVFFKNWSICGVDVRGRSGGLLLAWTKEVKLSILQTSEYGIHTTIENSDDTNCFYTFVYGGPDHRRRQIFLNDLTQLVVSINGPWACIGDWNFITSNKDKKGGNPIEYYRLMHLKSVIDQCGLRDLGYKG